VSLVSERWLCSAIAVLVVATYTPLFETLLSQSASNPYAAHVVVVPILAAGLLWADVHRARRSTDVMAPRRLCLAGMAVTAVAIACRSGHVLTQVLSLIAVLAGLVWSLYGSAGIRRAAFGLTFLLLMLPPPREIIAVIAPAVQYMVATVTAGIVSMLQIPVQQHGVFLRLPGLQVHVAEGCAGLRFLLILVVVTAAFARVFMPTTRGQLAVIGLSIPIAMLANLGRVLMITISAYAVGPEIATGPLHDYIGKGFWAVALLSLIGISILLRARTCVRWCLS